MLDPGGGTVMVYPASIFPVAALVQCLPVKHPGLPSLASPCAALFSPPRYGLGEAHTFSPLTLFFLSNLPFSRKFF